MERIVTLSDAYDIMGKNVIGPEELCSCGCLHLQPSISIPEIPYTKNELEDKKNDYMLILGVNHFSDGRLSTIRNFLNLFGNDPDDFEPCFYNQDWYLNEDFIDVVMPDGWFLIRKRIYESSRAVMPNILELDYSFPSAVRCVYAFFVTWLCRDEYLWWHDFVWCSDRDHNGDRIYVGKYNDIDGVNKNGFSIHRHLSLRPCYGAID